jgi:hypothetical protein
MHTGIAKSDKYLHKFNWDGLSRVGTTLNQRREQRRTPGTVERREQAEELRCIQCYKMFTAHIMFTVSLFKNFGTKIVVPIVI